MIHRVAILLPVLVASSVGLGCHLEGEAQYGTPGAEWESVAPAPAPVAAEEPAMVDADDEDATALVTFKSVLDPYGQWVDDPTYGTVWTPSSAVVGADFSPYLTGGHWSYTSEGYYWASDYEWGWAPFHYGRWVWTDGYGWAWIPGARYAPAWVDWRYGNGYIGWGPAYPHYCWRNGGVVYIGPGVAPYIFVGSGHFFHPHPHTVVVGPAYHPALVAGTTPYTPPPRPLTGARPFVGPEPKVAGIPTDHVAKATIVSPVKGRPETVAWTPAPSSKVAPAGKPYIPPASKPAPGGYAGAPTYTPGPKPYNPGAPTYTPGPKPTTPGYGPKPYNPPTYTTPPTYAPAPKPYNPPPTYSPAPKPYNPPTYAPAPKPYSPPPTYAPKPYSPPPTYSPAPKSYSPPPTYAPKPSFKKK